MYSKTLQELLGWVAILSLLAIGGVSFTLAAKLFGYSSIEALNDAVHAGTASVLWMVPIGLTGVVLFWAAGWLWFHVTGLGKYL